MSDDSIFWAHTPSKANPLCPHTVPDHLLGTANLCSEAAFHFGAQDFGYCAGLLHDIGKLTRAFQTRLRRADAGESTLVISHKAHGAAFVREILGDTPVANALIYVILGHHNGMINQCNVEGELEDLDDYALVKHRVLKLFPDIIVRLRALEMPAYLEDSSTIGWETDYEMFVRFLYGCLCIADGQDTEAHFNPSRAGRRNASQRDLLSQIGTMQQNLKKYVSGLGNGSDQNPRRLALRNRLQAEVWAKGAAQAPGFWTLSAPVGIGKFLSAIGWSLGHAECYKKRRVIYLAPYLTLTCQVAANLRKIVGADNMVEHHSVAETPPIGAEGHEMQGLHARNWDAPWVVSTYVQFFESLATNRPGKSYKLSNLANTIIIADELQRLPEELAAVLYDMLGILVRCFGVTVLCPSATLPCIERLEPGFAPLPPIHEVLDDPQSYYQEPFPARTEINREGWTWAETAARMNATRLSALTILDMRRDGWQLFEALKDGDYYLSSLMCDVHLLDTVDTLNKHLHAERKHGARKLRVVATQVVETGVDLDFANLFRAMAGLQSLLQAQGRCNRDWLREMEDCLYTVFIPTETNMPEISPFAAAAKRANSWLRTYPDELKQSSPTSFSTYMRMHYQKATQNSDLVKLQRARMLHSFEDVADLLKMVVSDDVAVLVPYDGAVYDRLVQMLDSGCKLYECGAELQRHCATIKKSEANRLLGTCIREVPQADGLYIWEGPYSTAAGLAPYMGW